MDREYPSPLELIGSYKSLSLRSCIKGFDFHADFIENWVAEVVIERTRIGSSAVHSLLVATLRNISRAQDPETVAWFSAA